MRKETRTISRFYHIQSFKQFEKRSEHTLKHTLSCMIIDVSFHFFRGGDRIIITFLDSFPLFLFISAADLYLYFRKFAIFKGNSTFNGHNLLEFHIDLKL